MKNTDDRVILRAKMPEGIDLCKQNIAEFLRDARLDCAFVDYYALRWQLGRDIKKELLVNLINHIEEKLPQA